MISILFRKIFMMLLVVGVFSPCAGMAGETAKDLLAGELAGQGQSVPRQMADQVDRAAGGILSATPLHDRIDFSTIPDAKVDVAKLKMPACLVMTPAAANYVFTGKPDSFQGSFRSYEFHIGEGLNKAARMIYPQVFEAVTVADNLAAAAPEAIAIVPETADFRFRMGGAFLPSLIASIKIRVGMYQDGRKFFEKTYEVNDVKKSSYTIFPSSKQEHKAISKAIIDALKLNAMEIGAQPEVLALLRRPAPSAVAASAEPAPQTAQAAAGQWVENAEAYDFDEDTERWIRENQHQVARAENASTRALLRQEPAPAPQPAVTQPEEAAEPVEAAEEEEAEEASSDDSYYPPLPEAYSFVPTELEKKRWAARKAQIDLARAERAAENRRIEREDRMAKVRNDELFAKRLKDNNWIYNNAVSTAVIDYGEYAILAGKVIVVGVACGGPQAAATCAPVTGTMVSYGRFDSLAAGIGEGTAEYQRSGDLTKAISKGTVTGVLDQVAGEAGGKLMQKGAGKVLKGSQALGDGVADTVRKKVYRQTQAKTGAFVPGRFDTRIKSHIYKANKNSLRVGLKRAVINSGSDAGKEINKRLGPGKMMHEAIDEAIPDRPQGRSFGEGA